MATRYLIVTAVLLASMATADAATIPNVARTILLLDWSTMDINAAIDATVGSDIDRDIAAPLTGRDECSELRVLRLTETVAAGQCLRCLRFEFIPRPTHDGYALATLVVDYTSSKAASISTLLRDLLRDSGNPETVIDLPRGDNRSSKWSRSWTVPNEMRSLSVDVVHEAHQWRVHFDHRRSRIEGVPATPQ